MVFILTLIFALVRIVVQPSDTLLFDSFKAFAHMYVGGLFGAWWVTWPRYSALSAVEHRDRKAKSLYYLSAAIILSLVEVGCALWQKLA